MYSIIKAKTNSRSFKKFLEKDFPRLAYEWYLRMCVNCKYEER